MKRAIAMVLMAALLAFSLCGCGASGFDGLYDYLEKNGTSGEDGKRVAITVENKVKFDVYFEAADTGKIILGYHLNVKTSTAVTTGTMKIYLDGKSDPYFETSSVSTLIVSGIPVNMEEYCTGHIDISADKATANIESCSRQGFGQTSTEVLDTTEKSVDLDLQRIWNNLPQLIEKTGVNISMEDLGLAG